MARQGRWTSGVRMAAALLLAVIAATLVHSATQAQPFGIGDTVKCYGSVGTIVRTEPRYGGEPFSIVKSEEAGSTSGEIRCFQKEMTAAAPPVTLAERCRPGAKVEAAWGISWYEATVLTAPDAEKKCKVHFDGYAALYDAMVGITQLRPRGSGPIVRPSNPVRETAAPARPAPATARTTARAPDGVYQCHKILSGGQLGYTGTLTMRGGRGNVNGLPGGWKISSIRPTYDDRRNLVVVVAYVSARGTRDEMDCVVE